MKSILGIVLYFLVLLSHGSADSSCAFVLKVKGKLLTFKIEGRSAAERRFKQERDHFEESETSGTVVVEWLFHPFYIPRGHTSLRIGNTLYEFSPAGWKIHDSGANNARAFLFNNPFFKRMYSMYRTQDMPPFSVGVPISVPKSVAYRIDEWIRGYSENNGEVFSYLFHNCNHCLIDALELSGAKDFALDSFGRFSSLITMRKLLRQAAEQEEVVYIYPLPDTNKSELSTQMPAYLLEDSSYWRELIETLKSFGNYRGFIESYRRVFLGAD